MRPLLLGLLFFPSPGLFAGPALAVFDAKVPGSETRFTIDLEWMNRVATWLAEADATVVRVGEQDMALGGSLNGKTVAALFMPGDTVPRNRIEDLKRYVEDGGILVCLDAKLPWVIAMVLGPDHTWRLSPREPKFAWQTMELLGHLGLEYLYDPPRHDTGIQHGLTALGRKYLAGAFQDRNQLRSGMWVVPTAGARYIPLIRTRRADGADVVPLVAMVEHGNRRSIICTDGKLTRTGADAALMVKGLGRLALDWHGGTLVPGREDGIALDRNLPILGPLSKRLTTGEVNPEGAVAVKRWGRFNGSDVDLVESPTEGIPRRLKAGGATTLELAARSETTWLRLRLAFQVTGAGLRVELNRDTLWNETLSYVDSSGPGNYDSMDLGNMPLEITRCLPIPAGPAGALTVENPGTHPVFFDAGQLERRPAGTPPWVLGAMIIDIGGRANIPLELSKRWSYARLDMRLNKVGPPGVPNRWETVDALVSNVLASGAPLHAMIGGCPEFAAISPERYAEGKKAGRPHCVPPDPDRYADLVAEAVARYGRHIALYEIWNEANIRQFWRGTPEEYAAFLKKISSVIRQKDPGKIICSAGMAGFNESYLETMVAEGTLPLTDWFGFHPYAGKAPAWDVPAGLLTGKLMSLGLDPVIYWNEMGFPWKPGEWFQGTYTPEVQALLTDRALARFTATGATRLNLFHGGGLEHHFSLISKSGEPYPAYRIFEDYLRLAEKGGRRWDVSLTAKDGSPLTGIYVTGAVHEDGTITVIVNPAETTAPFPEIRFGIPVPHRGPVTVSRTLSGGPSTPIPSRNMKQENPGWLEVTLPLEGRTTLRVTRPSTGTSGK